MNLCPNVRDLIFATGCGENADPFSLRTPSPTLQTIAVWVLSQSVIWTRFAHSLYPAMYLIWPAKMAAELGPLGETISRRQCHAGPAGTDSGCSDKLVSTIERIPALTGSESRGQALMTRRKSLSYCHSATASDKRCRSHLQPGLQPVFAC